jgi:hypothetical protein
MGPWQPKGLTSGHGADVSCQSSALSHSCGRNGMKSGMASTACFSSISSLTPLFPEIWMSLSKSADLSRAHGAG